MRLNTLIRRVERVREEIVPDVKAACEKEEKTIVTLNQLALTTGWNTNGELMNGGNYSPHYMRFKQRMGVYNGVVDLSLTGDMQRGMYVEYSETGFSVKTTDWKQWMVDYTMETGHWPPGNQPEYGPVFGLSESDKGFLAWKIAPSVASRLRRKLLN